MSSRPCFARARATSDSASSVPAEVGALQGQRLAIRRCLRFQRAALRLLHVWHHHLRTIRQQSQSNGAAKPAAAARYQRYLSRKIVRHPISPPCSAHLPSGFGRRPRPCPRQHASLVASDAAERGADAMFQGAADPAHRLLDLLLAQRAVARLQLQGAGQTFLPGGSCSPLVHVEERDRATSSLPASRITAAPPPATASSTTTARSRLATAPADSR